MKTIDRNLMQIFLERAGDRISGKWVIIGGAVMSLIESGERPTLDIDLAGPETAHQTDTLVLMEIAEEIGLPVESINQAGAFFLRKIPRWDKELVEVHSGKRATFYRPNALLFILLKMMRLTPVDLQDCAAMLRFAKSRKEKVDTHRLKTAINLEIEKAKSKEYAHRLSELLTLVVGSQ